MGRRNTTRSPISVVDDKDRKVITEMSENNSSANIKVGGLAVNKRKRPGTGIKRPETGIISR